MAKSNTDIDRILLKLIAEAEDDDAKAAIAIARTVWRDSLPNYSDYNMGGSVAQMAPATAEDVFTLLGAGENDDGRSHFTWIRFANGDLGLIVFPMGETYEALEEAFPV